MSLKKYETFIKTVELGSLTKAASALNLTQSAVSHIISNLEDELGASLLVRGRGGLRLTSVGEKVLPMMREIVQKNAELEAFVRNMQNGGGAVRVGTFTSVAVNWLPRILKGLHAEHPEIEINMFSGDYHDVEQWLISGEVDIGFVAMPVPDELSCIPLKDDPLLVILPKSHPLAEFETVPAEEIVKEPLISLLQTSAQDIHRALDSAGVKPDIKYTTKDDYAIIAMVREGLGIGIMPGLLLNGVDRDIAARPISPSASRTIALAISKKAERTKNAELFSEYVTKWVNENT